MKKRILASLLTLALLLLGVPAVAADEADDYDRLAVEAGYHARVGSAEEAYADGEFTGYLVLGEDLDGNQRDHVLDDVPAGSTVTLITDVQMTYQLYLNSACTLDGNGYTLHGAIRSDSGTADMVVKNLTIVTPLGPQDGGRNPHNNVCQINPGNVAVFENVRFEFTGQPQFGSFVVNGGNLTLRNCTVVHTDDVGGSAEKEIFRMNANDTVLTLEDTTVEYQGSNPLNAVVRCVKNTSSTLSLMGETTLTAAGGSLFAQGSNAYLRVNLDSTVDVAVPEDGGNYNVSRTNVWDGSVDVAWFDENSIQDSYELDSAAKVAGLAKIVQEKQVKQFPSNGRETPVTFYITVNLDLNGLEWLPIGTSSAPFGGNVIGREGGMENAPVTIRNLKIDTATPNCGFIGSLSLPQGAEVSNMIFINPQIRTTAQKPAVVCGYAREGAVFENIHVYGATIAATNATYVGGICAQSGYAPDTYRNCVFIGDITVDGVSEKVGGLVGNPREGTTITDCYVAGCISTGDTVSYVGGLVGYLDAGTASSISSSQFDGYLQAANAGGAGNGAVVGELVAGADSDGTTGSLSLEQVFCSGISIGFGADVQAAYAWVGRISGSGSVALSGAELTALSPMPLVGSRAEDAGLASEPAAPTVLGGADVMGEAGAAALGGTGWSAREKGYPVRANAAGHAPDEWALADFTWFDPAASSYGLSDVHNLAGFLLLSRMYDFSGKTVSLTQTIDASDLGTAVYTVGGSLGGSMSASFLGTFEKAGFAILNATVEFGALAAYTVTWDLGYTTIAEEYKYGDLPSFKGETTRPDDRIYSYEFNGWDREPEAVYSDTTYTARWIKTLLKDLDNDADGEGNGDGETQPPQTDNGQPTVEAPPADEEGCASAAPVVLLPLLLLSAALPLLLPCRRKKAALPGGTEQKEEMV